MSSQTLKDIKHIRRDFHVVAWVMPQGSDLGVLWVGGGGVGGSIFIPPPITLFVVGILFSRCPSVRPSVRLSVTLCFLNIL